MVFMIQNIKNQSVQKQKLNYFQIKYIGVCVLFLFGLSFSVGAHAGSDNLHLILVNGLAEKTVEPNMVNLQIESWAKATSAKAAQDLQAQNFNKIKSLIEKNKIKKEDFQTQNFSVNPESTYDQKTQTYKVTGFRVSHQISLIVRKTDEVGGLIDRLVSLSTDKITSSSSGVNVQNISWDYDKRSIVESAAVGEAVKAARLKAEELAQAAGVSIKAVHRLQHTSRAVMPQSPVVEMKAMRASDSSSLASTELSAGTVKVMVEVQMEFEIN